jgi:outer membrane protein assembly factor BamA
VNYGIHTALWRGAALGLSGFLESTRDSGGLYAANTQLTGGVAQLQQKISNKLSLTIGYGFTHIDPTAQPQSPFVSSADFNQHAYSAALAYQLCPKSSLNLGWQHFETTVPGFNFGTFRQERITVGMRVVF